MRDFLVDQLADAVARHEACKDEDTDWHRRRQEYFETTVFDNARLRDRRTGPENLRWQRYERFVPTETVAQLTKKQRKHLDGICLDGGRKRSNLRHTTIPFVIEAWAPVDFLPCNDPRPHLFPPVSIGRDYRLHEICAALVVLHDAGSGHAPFVPEEHDLFRPPFSAWLACVRVEGLASTAEEWWISRFESFLDLAVAAAAPMPPAEGVHGSDGKSISPLPFEAPAIGERCNAQPAIDRRFQDITQEPRAAAPGGNQVTLASFDETVFVFAPSGTGYFVRAFGVEGIVNNSVGFRHLRTLLTQPGVRIRTIELHGGTEGESPQEITDRALLTDAKRQRDRLEQEFATATAAGRGDAAAEAKDEISKIDEHIAKCKGKGGSLRTVPTAANSAAASVRSSIGRAKKALRGLDPPLNGLATHLEKYINIGQDFTCYDPAEPIPLWTFSSPQSPQRQG